MSVAYSALSAFFVHRSASLTCIQPFPLPVQDDAFALLLAAYHPSLNLLGVTTVGGNSSLERTTLNALKVLHIAGLDERRIPVVPGRHEPLLREAFAAQHAGSSGLDGPDFPPVPTQPTPGHAATFIYDTAKRWLSDRQLLPSFPSPLSQPFTTADSAYSNPDGITVLAIGPLTNIALLLLMYPNARLLLKQIVLMGGALGAGNASPSAEFNMFLDPEAARVVFQSGVALTMVPLEVTHSALVTPQVVARVRGLGSRFGAMCEELLLFFQAAHEKEGYAFVPLHDPCAVAWLVDEALFEWQWRRVEVEVEGRCAGRTAVDVYGVTKGRKNVRVCTAMKVDAFWQLMHAAIEAANARSPVNAVTNDA